MQEVAPNVIVIPAKADAGASSAVKRQLRVAAYCRVSTDNEEQLTSYKAQKNYYTDKIMGNPEWTLAGIFADEGISGTSTKKRDEFLHMIRLCRQGKIDMVLTKSVSRFSRNTLDCLKYTRLLRQLKIPVIFESQGINSMDPDAEFMITIFGSHAQSQSVDLGHSVSWGKRQAMREGRAYINYRSLYGYVKGDDGKPKIVPDQAEVVREIFNMYLGGASLRTITKSLVEKAIPYIDGKARWNAAHIQNILSNEKYCGDVLQQKTFTEDVLSHKVVKNTGQLPMYLIENHHEGIISREIFRAVQAEMARRKAGRSPSKNAVTGRSTYSSRYALTERLVCGECGTLYRRCTWTQNGSHRIVWRCVSRLDYGKKYCKRSPTLDEDKLQRSILAAINRAMSRKESLIRQIQDAAQLELAPSRSTTGQYEEIQRRMAACKRQADDLLAKISEEGGGIAPYQEVFHRLTEEMSRLQEQQIEIEQQNHRNASAAARIDQAVAAMRNASPKLTEWDDSLIRQLVDMVKVLSADKILVYLKGGVEIQQDLLLF